jgi:hypothetical protein
VDRAFGREFRSGGFEHFFAASANINGGAEFEEAGGHAFTEACASASDEGALVLQKVRLEHGIK